MNVYRQPAPKPDVVAMRPLVDGVTLLPNNDGRVLMRWLLPDVTDVEALAIGASANRERLHLSARKVRFFVETKLSELRGRPVEARDLSTAELADLPRWCPALGRYDPA